VNKHLIQGLNLGARPTPFALGT